MRIYDLTDLRFSLAIKKSNGTGGSFFKARDNDYYYKLSYTSGIEIIGFESVYEAIANELLKQLGLYHSSGELLRAKVLLDSNEIITNVWKTKDFNPQNNPVITLEAKMEIEKVDINDGMAVLRAVSEFPHTVRNLLYEMFLFDYIIRNVDRHGANIELMYVDNKIQCAPIFDNGSSFFSTCQRDIEKITSMDILKDSAVNNFIGSIYLEKAAEKVIASYQRKTYSFDTSFLKGYSDYFEGYGDIIIPRIEKMINARKDRLNSIIEKNLSQKSSDKARDNIS